MSSIGPHRRVRTPTVLQMDATEAGAAALTMVLNALGRDVLLQDVREACSVTRDGVNIHNMVAAAETYGFDCTESRSSAADLSAIEPPFIVLWGQNHFLVVEGFGRRKVHVNDPASGHRTMSFEEFSQGFSGSVLVCRRRPGFKPDPRRERRRPTVEMLRLLGTSKRSVAYAAIAGVALVVPTTAAAALASIFVDQVLKQGNDNWAVTVVVLAALVGLLLFLLSLFQQRV